MFCKKCGTQLENGAKFCRKCGNPVDSNAVQPNTVQKQPQINKNQTINVNNQRTVNPEKQSSAVRDDVKTKKSINPALIIGLVAAVVAVVVIAIAGLFLLSGDDSDDSTSKRTERLDETEDTEDTDLEETDTSEIDESSESDDLLESDDSDDSAYSDDIKNGDSSQNGDAAILPYAFTDEEWTLIQHGAAYLIVLLGEDLSGNDVFYTKDLTQSQLNSFTMMYFNNNYYDELEALFPSNGSANSYVAYSESVVKNVVKSVFGNDSYAPSTENGIKVNNGIVSYEQAFGAPRYVTRRYSAYEQGNTYIVDVEMAALANVAYWVEGLYRLNLVRDNSNPLGYAITSVQKIENNVIVSSVDASSTLKEGNNTTKYHRNNVTDHSMLTAWVEGASDNGIGESITLQLDGTQLVHGFRIASGYMKSNNTYNENAAPKRLGIELSGGIYFEVDLVDDYEGYIRTNQTRCLSWGERAGMIGQDASQWDFAKDFMDTVSFGAEYETSYIKITILDVKSGTKYTDTCISEIMPY